MEKRAKQVVFGGIIVTIALVAVLITALIEKYTPSKERIDLSQYYTVPEGEAMIILDDTIYDKNAKMVDGTMYVDIDTIKEKFNHRFYWDAIENYLIYTTPTEVIKTELGSKDYYVNKPKSTEDYVIVKTIDGQVYVALEFVEKFSDITYQVYDNPNRVIIQSVWGDYLVADVKKDTMLRMGTSIKEKILCDVEKGDKLTLIDAGGSGKNGFIKVMTKDGVRGYVQKKQISDTYYDTRKSGKSFQEYTSLTKDYTINLVWHQVTNMEANQYMSNLLEKTKSVTTISPTWFRINSKEGTLSSLLSESYVEKAHGMGIEVWALVDNFDPEVDSFEVFSRSSSRERLVNEIIAQAIQFNLDGINIDFENLTQETGPHYVQFLRELSVKCRTNQIVLSVDNYVPQPYSKFYDRAEQGRIIDYLVIMGYDEHHSNSEEAGSVSSISYIKDAINNILEVAPKEKIIMGIPFYTRLWKESVELGENVLSSEAYGMNQMDEILSKNGVTPEWDDITKQYYAEYTKNDAVYKVWLENDESIDAKMKLIKEADLAGVASWRLGFENPSVWNVIQKYVN